MGDELVFCRGELSGWDVANEKLLDEMAETVVGDRRRVRHRAPRV